MDFGWSFRHVEVIDGRIDRLAECNKYFESDCNAGHYKIEECCMRGTTYYAAVRKLTEYHGDKGHLPLNENDQYVFGVVILTHVDKSFYNFGQKIIYEFDGPTYYNCPLKILNKLSPTADKKAMEWRRKCHEYFLAAKDPDALNNLPVGSRIMFRVKEKMNIAKIGEEVVLTKYSNGRKHRWIGKKYVWPNRSIPNDYEVISRGKE